jgi:hypothetical protein
MWSPHFILSHPCQILVLPSEATRPVTTYRPVAANAFSFSSLLHRSGQIDFQKGSIVMPQQLAFVPTDGSARIRTPERQLIRHHCMRQKNKQPGSRRSKREAARAAAGYSRKFEKQDQESSSGPQPIPTRDQVVSRSELSAGEGRKQASSRQDTVPPPPPSDWALFQFPEELDISSQNLMHQCT